ncbi:MAG: hypothetical protein K6E47_12215 [Lachnospiraceae bacterium]|nr:hypothetical protein [Lachnospiraceae bacterium]
MIRLGYEHIKKIAYLFLAIPFLVFSIGWLKWYWAVLVCLGLFMTAYFGTFHSDLDDASINKKKEITVSIKVLLIILVIAIIWVWQSGIGGMWAQSKDFTYRNAIFRDIVLRDWPVIYPVTGHALVYYIGYWLVPALFGKAALCLGFNNEVSFRIADGALFIWTVFLILIVFILVIITLRVSDSKKQLFTALFFIFFSGMDIWGNIGYSLNTIEYHLEWWAYDYQYSSFSTCLFWVYNQAVPAWLCLLCVLNEKSAKNYVFIGMMCLFNAPIPFVGLFVFCICLGIKKGLVYIKENKVKFFVKDVISIPNIIGACLFFPIIASYVLSNAAIQGTGSFRLSESIAESAEVRGSAEIPFSNNPAINYVSFILIEFGLYLILTSWKYRKSFIYYVAWISLLIIPLLKIGEKKDFAMRASIPALLVVFLLICKYLFEEKEVLKQKDSLKRLSYILLIFFLVLGSITPLTEFLRGGKYVSEYGIRNEEKYDNIYTLGCDGPYDEQGHSVIYANFVAVDLDRLTFFKIFCK